MHTGNIILIIILASVLWAMAVKVRVLMVAKRRSGMAEQQFVAALVGNGVPEDVGRAVFASFRKWGSCIAPDFPLTPDLTLRDFIPWVEYDETEIFEEILVKTRRCWPREKLLPWKPDWTLQEVANFVANCPRNI